MPRPGQKTRQEAARMWALGQAAEKNQKRLLTLASPQTQMLASWKPSKSEPPLGEGQGPDIQRRMSAAFDRLEAEKLVQETATKVDSKTTRQLGKLVLEFEQVNNNLLGIQKGIKKDIRERNRLFDKKKKLKEKEEKELKSLKGAFFGFRARVGAVSGAIALKELAEGDIAGATQPAAVAVASFLPEIINITSSVVLGGLALRGLGGGRGRVAAPAGARAPRIRGGGRAGLLLGAGGLALGAAGVGMFGGGSEERRQELVAQATAENTIAPEDVNRFSSQLTRFNKVIDLMLQRMKGQDDPTFTPPKDENGIILASNNQDTLIPGRNPPVGAGGNVFSQIDVNDPEAKAFIATVRQLEGTAGPGGYNTWFGKRTDMDLSKMTVSQVVAEQKRRLATGEATYGKYTSAAVGAGQFMKPEETVREMGLDPDKVKYTPELQNKMILFQAMKRRGVDPTKPLSIEDVRKLGKEWASFTPYHGQTNRTAGESLRVYEQNLEKARQLQSTAPTTGQPMLMNLNVPGQTQTVTQAPPQQVESQSTPYIDTNYPSNDRFASNLLLGAFA